MIGERCAEVGPFLRNKLDGCDDLRGVIGRRLSIFAERLCLAIDRLTAWAQVDAVLSAWWSIEDTGRCPREALEVVDAVMSLG